MSSFQLLHSVDEILLLNIDVSFAATSFALSDLAQHQAVQTKLRAEIDDVLQGRDPSEFQDLDKKLAYMETVLKESARMHPALALSLPEKTVKSVTELGGYQILKGVREDGFYKWLVYNFLLVARLHSNLLMLFVMYSHSKIFLYYVLNDCTA